MNTTVTIPQEYLLDEVREGYYVPAMIKKAWAAELTILGQIDQICKKHGIRYFADWGTMLGAVRHAGFVPWDDDLDISMLRPDYEKFCQVAVAELPEGYFLENFHTDPSVDLFLGRVTGRRHICFEEDYLAAFHDFPYRAGIDIFVLDYLPRDPEAARSEQEKCLKLIAIADALYSSHDEKARDGKAVALTDREENLVKEAERLTGARIDRREHLRQQIYILTEREFASVTEEEADIVVQMFPWGLKGIKTVPKQYYEKTIRLPFECTTVPVPAAYDIMLRRRYGDFMKVVKNAGAHDYPYYEGQKREFEEENGITVPSFFDPVMQYTEELLKPKDPEVMKRRNRMAALGEDSERRIVVFLPFKGAYWEYLRPYYEKEAAREDTDVFVIPIPFFYKRLGRAYGEEILDYDDYPSDLPGYDYHIVDLECLHPDVIYIQNPYDAYHASITVPEEYYASHLRSCTERLVYVPYFEADPFERNMACEAFCLKYYCLVPGVLYADSVILFSEGLKERFAECWNAFSGGRIRIGEKLTVAPKSTKTEASGKKKVLYRTTLGVLSQFGLEAIEKIKRSLAVFRSQTEHIELVWSPQRELRTYSSCVDPDVWAAFEELVAAYRSENFGVYDERTEDAKLADMCDAYYGDAHAVVMLFLHAGKPVMIEEVSNC